MQKCVFAVAEGSQPSYTEHWTHGRYVMMGLIPGIPIALAFPNPFLDLALSGALVLHSHWYVQFVLIAKCFLFARHCDVCFSL